LRTLKVLIQAGRLTLNVRREELPLEDCLTCATRQNPRRLYLFVSKVLGKHWPVRPSVMAAVHARLGAKIVSLPGPILVIGMAETATALGRGVAEEAANQSGRDDILYLQTTRYRLSRPLAFSFDESHSHAPDHAVYLPDPALRPLFGAARTLVLVDDEISTGRTLIELARACCKLNPHIERVALVCITNWLSSERQQELATSLEKIVLFPSLIEGDFTFEPDPQFPSPDLPIVIANTDRQHDRIVADSARIGLIAGRRLSPPVVDLPPRRPLAVIGTGEYAYIPFRIALLLEQRGYDVCFQSTTRSPILVGDAISSRREFPDNYGDGIPNYLYNLDDKRLPIICYEHPTMPSRHPLVDQIGALTWITE